MNYKIKTRPKIPRNKYGYLAPTSTGGAKGVVTGNIQIGDVSSDVEHAKEADHAANATTADHATYAVSAGYAVDAYRSEFSKEADHAENAEHALSADNALEAQHAHWATNADHAGMADKLTNPVKLWGNDFDGSQDINSPIHVEDIYVDTIHPKTDDIKASGNIIPTLDNTYSIGSNSKRFKDVYSTNINNSDTITTKNLTVTGLAHFFELMIDKISSVGGSALFTPADGFVIDKIEPIIRDNYNRYRIYWKNTDGDGNARVNMWKRGDQALCMTFNKATVETSYEVSNKYYWCYVPWTSNDERENNQEYNDDGYNFIDIIVEENGFPSAVGTVNPEIGDNIVMCGHRKHGDETDDEAAQRGGAIYIAAYNGLDNGIKAPFIAQYKAINDFALQPFRQSYFDAVGAKFVGDFTITPQQITEIAKQVDLYPPYISDGTDGFTEGNWIIWDKENNSYKDSGISAKGDDGKNGTYREYIYQASTTKPSKPTYIYKSSISSPWSLNIPQPSENEKIWYTSNIATWYDDDWTYQSHAWTDVEEYMPKGDNAIMYRLYPINELALVNLNEVLGINFKYIIQKIDGELITSVDSKSDELFIRFNSNTSTTYTNLSYTSTPSYVNSEYQTSYYTTHKGVLKYFTIELVNANDNKVLDSRVIYVTLEAGATFQINQELGSITSRVQNTETGITSLTNRVTTVEQTATGITSRVGALETSVGGFDERISTVEQTASGIVSTVSSMNTVGSVLNLLPDTRFDGRPKTMYFNGDKLCYITKTQGYNNMNAFRCYIPYSSTNYQYYGVHWGHSGNKSIKLTIGKTYTLSCWVKPNVDDVRFGFEVWKVDSQYGNRVAGEKQICNDGEVTYWILKLKDGWQHLKATFKAKYEYNEIFMFTYNDPPTDTYGKVQDMLICMPMLAEGEITQWTPYIDDDVSTTYGNMLNNTDTFKLADNLTTVQSKEKEEKDYGVFPNSNYNFVHNDSLTTYNELAEWTLGETIQPDTDYVLSFWAKGYEIEVENPYDIEEPIIYKPFLNTHFYYPTGGVCMVTETSEGYYNSINYSVTSGTDGWSEIYLSDNWKKYWIHWHTIKSFDNIRQDYKKLIKVLLRQPQNRNVYISQVKFEQGVIPTEYTVSTVDYSNNMKSEIKQTADEIKLTVSNDLKETGIDITNGQINLNAENTNVSNNLTVGSLQTRGNNATIDISDGQMKVYGNNQTQPNIVFGIGENGYAVLSYYDNDGKLLYNLGPQGIFNTFGSEPNKFFAAQPFLKVSTMDGFNVIMMRNLTSVDIVITTPKYYQFAEGYQWISEGRVKRYNISQTTTPSNLNEGYYDSNGLSLSDMTPTGNQLANGCYIYGVQETVYENDKRKLHLVYVNNGKIVNNFMAWYKYLNSTWRLCDNAWNLIQSTTIQYIDYLTLTSQR